MSRRRQSLKTTLVIRLFLIDFEFLIGEHHFMTISIQNSSNAPIIRPPIARRFFIRRSQNWIFHQKQVSQHDQDRRLFGQEKNTVWVVFVIFFYEHDHVLQIRSKTGPVCDFRFQTEPEMTFLRPLLEVSIIRFFQHPARLPLHIVGKPEYYCLPY